MNNEEMKEFSKLSGMIGAGIEGLLKAQELLADMMCKHCDIPIELKQTMIDDMNKVIGIKTL